MLFSQKKVECIALFDYKGNPRPIRIRLEDEYEGRKVIEVHRIIDADIKKQYATRNSTNGLQYKFKCETILNNIVMPFELRFEVNTCIWYLL